MKITKSSYREHCQSYKMNKKKGSWLLASEADPRSTDQKFEKLAIGLAFTENRNIQNLITNFRIHPNT